MPKSSESVAALAAALAKAQAELVNPKKSLTATIQTGRPGEGQRSFRYARCPVASTSCARRSASTRSQPYRRLRPHCRYGQSLATTFVMHVAHVIAGRDLGGPLRLRHDNCAA